MAGPAPAAVTAAQGMGSVPAAEGIGQVSAAAEETGPAAGGIGPAAVAARGVGPARFVFGALAVAVGAMAALHLFGIGRLDPASTTVSDYVALPGGATLLAVAVLAVAAATAGVAAAQLTAGAPRWLAVPYGIGCFGLAATVAFPTNAIGTAATVDTVLHRYAAGLFFVSLPVAAALSLRHHPNRAGSPLTAASVLIGLAFLASHLHQIAAVLPRGITERALLVVDIALLAVLAAAPRRADR